LLFREAGAFITDIYERSDRMAVTPYIALHVSV